MSALTIDSTGKIVVAGCAQVNATDYDMAFARINPGGGMDTSFSTDGKRTVWFDDGGGDYDCAADVAALPDGRIVATGLAATAADGYDIAVVRLQSNSDQNPTFGIGGRVRIPFNLGGGWTPCCFCPAI